MTTEVATTQDFKKDLHEHIVAAGLGVHAKWVDQVMQSRDPDVLRRYMEWATKTVGAEADTKTDKFAGLPIFNFTFNGSAMQIQAQAPEQSALANENLPVLEMVVPEPVPAQDFAEARAKTSMPAEDAKFFLRSTAVEEVDQLMAQLDEMLALEESK